MSFDAITLSRVAGSSWFATDERFLGSPPQLRVLLAQTADTLYVVAAHDHEKQVLARVLRAARGKGAIENEPHAKTYLDTHARDQFVVLTDVVQLLEWERRLGVPGLPKPVRGEGGRNSLAFSSRPLSETEHEYVLAMSQRMIDVFRGL